MVDNKHTVSIDTARAILGEKGKTMTEKQVQDLLELLRTVCDKTIDSAIESDYAR